MFKDTFDSLIYLLNIVRILSIEKKKSYGHITILSKIHKPIRIPIKLLYLAVHT